MVDENKPLCLVVGVGGGTGEAVVRRFLDEGYNVAMIARNDAYLRKLERELSSAVGYPCDIGSLYAFENTLTKILSELGVPKVVVHNAVRAKFDFYDTANPEDFERNFRVNVTSLLCLTRFLHQPMQRGGGGALVVTGNTASYRGIPRYAVFAATKAAQRVLSESLARELWPKGIHVAYVSVDAAIMSTWLPDEDRPWMQRPEDWSHPPEDYYADTQAIANEIFHVSHQHKSTWSFDHVVRPYAENW